ncbi:AAA domain-containing protein [Pseudofrankia sp. BMG5.37]|uniref:DEAD/DEAH box helicase n=1 Tax=Pseudofrankia sp. BMG5.37 TaxID=3050035 RepID=UPI002893FF9A|nr:AAA domain-containing protein [Pseudofrankia sp. BMG5.37]MDT3440705.1 AAA domain-containing protein [Pseudofrankia sp. BMG5.37]
MTGPAPGSGAAAGASSTRARVTLPGPLAVVPSARAIDELGQAPLAFIAELTELSAYGALPARLESGGKGRLVVYGRRYVAFLYPTNYGDAYRLGYVSRRSFWQEDKLTLGALLLHCPAGWHAFHDVRDIQGRPGTAAPRWSSYWDILAYHWSMLGPRADMPVRSSLPERHREYLEVLGQLVEADRDIEIARQTAAPPLLYQEVRSTREERHSGRGVYAFTLVRPGRAGVTVNAPVELVDIGGDRLRGTVVRIDNSELVVRFEKAVDFQRIPSPSGELRRSVSDRVSQAQLDAIKTLAAGGSANPNLLYTLVDGVYAPYQPDLGAAPRRDLDDHQKDAFARALEVPDVLLVLGPPGTGKTRTIAEIVTALVAQGRRVLVTSHTNRAVDNVLENLPPEINVVRVGAEHSMTATAREHSVDNLAEAVRVRILAAAEPRGKLAGFTAEGETFGRWLAFLGDRLAAAAAAEAGLAAAEEALDRAVETVSPPLAASRRAAADQLARSASRRHQLGADLEHAVTELARREAGAPAGPPAWWRLLARFRRWCLARLRRHVEALRADISAVERASTDAAATVEALHAQATALLAASPAYAALPRERDRLVAARRECYQECQRAAQILRSAVRTAAEPAIGIWKDDPTDEEQWARFRTWAADAVETMADRARLLDEWHAQAANTEAEIQRELVRYADVVAATCIGTATSPLLSGLIFDVALIDEAGQISTPNLIVPMVRARRSVLVGDQHQLPPYLDEELRGWADRLRANGQHPPHVVARTSDLLRASGFELLVPDAAATGANYVELNLQRRMPEELGRFVSGAFYQGRLMTKHDGVRGDPVFGAPFAMIDTSDRPSSQRREESPGRTERETARQPGYINTFEAELIALLVGRAVGWYRDWAVIVPYKAQARRIGELLGGALGDPAKVADNIGTVDSFQGGERDLIVYGFTRSNGRGSVGFLTELRRINVAVSRARRQLVMVGDLLTLCSATDSGFRELMETMMGHLRQHGEIRPSAEIEKLLRGQP